MREETEKPGVDAEAVEVFHTLSTQFMEHATQLAAASIHMQMLMLSEARTGMDEMLAAMEAASDTATQSGDRRDRSGDRHDGR